MNTSILDEKLIKKKIISMILPITAENILQMTAGVVSMAMVSRISATAVGAIGIGTIIIRIIWAVLKGIATGNSVFVAQSFGAKDYNRLRNSSIQALVIMLGASLVFQQVIYWNAETLLKIFNPSPVLLEAGTSYLKILSFSLPFTGMILLAAGILQGMGNAKTPMIIVAILNLINIFFSYILVFGNFGLPVLGLSGAAIAYNISYVFASCLAVYSLFNRESMFSKIRANAEEKFTMKGSMNLVKFAIPTSFEMSFWQFASIIITRAVLTYGEIAYAAYQLGLQAESISFMPAAGFGIAASTFIGQAIGSNDRELGRRYFKHLVKISLMITFFAAMLLLLFPTIIMRALSSDLKVVSIGAVYLFVMGIVQVPQNVASLINGALRGAGYPNAAMINVGAGLWLVRVPLVLIVTYVLNANIYWIWIVMGLDLVVRFILAVIVFKKKDIFKQTQIGANN
ncbi:MAG: MATE family efflux transporter [Gudongella sp.]|nr:MATE family efflux transporter [Gudongella sp.]